MKYELLIQNHDNTSPDSEIDRSCYKKGDIICIRPQGSSWTDAEKKNVVKCEMTETEKTKFESEVLDESTQVRLQRRKYKCNVNPDAISIKTILKSDLIEKP